MNQKVSKVSNITTYIKQRINGLTWFSLAAYLLIVAQGQVVLTVENLVTAPLIFTFLVSLRLFDDLFNSTIDLNKNNRSYTIPQVKSSLAKSLLLILIGLCVVVFTVSDKHALYLLAFLVVNYLSYLLLFRFEVFQFLLPVLKYVFVVLVFQSSFNLLSLAVLLLFIMFEFIDNKMHQQKLTVVLLIGVYLLLMSTNFESDQLLWVGVVGLLSIVILLLKVRYVQYLLLLLFLISRLIL